MSHKDILLKSKSKIASTHQFWAENHYRALTNPQGFESALLGMIGSLAQYADEHKTRHESPIGEDYVLGDEWAKAVRAVRGLLNGELGRLDGGTLDSILVAMLQEEGLAEE